jgi:hypothetical protein
MVATHYTSRVTDFRHPAARRLPHRDDEPLRAEGRLHRRLLGGGGAARGGALGRPAVRAVVEVITVGGARQGSERPHVSNRPRKSKRDAMQCVRVARTAPVLRAGQGSGLRADPPHALHFYAINLVRS